MPARRSNRVIRLNDDATKTHHGGVFGSSGYRAIGIAVSDAEPVRRQDFASSFGVASCFISSGYWNAAKIKVSGITPNTLNVTQVSVDWVRQTISLSTASARKNSAQRTVSLRQPSSVR